MIAAIELIKTMPRSEMIGGAIFAIGFPIIFWAIWVMTSA
jgi:hypothetical protein